MKFEISNVSLEPCIDSKYVKPKRVRYVQNGVEKVWDVVETHSSVSLLIYEKDTERFVLVKQFRPAVFLNNQEGVTYELCAGLIDKDKTLEEIAKEEAFEECGYEIPLESIKKITSFYTSVGFSGGKQHLFFAEVESSQNVAKGGGVDGEEIEVVYLHKERVHEFLFDENYAKTPGLLFALSWYLKGWDRGERFERVLVKQSKAATIGEMLGAIIHQWKQPLSTISLLAGQMVHRQMLGSLKSEHIKGISQSIVENVQQMSDVIEQLKSFYESDKAAKDFNALEATQQMIKIIKPQLDLRCIDIELKSSGGTFVIFGYVKLFKQAVANLLFNSKDAIMEKAKISPKSDSIGKIDITLTSDNEEVEILIKDNGIGLQNWVVEKLFEPFITTKDDGSGMGLYITRVIVEDILGGKIMAVRASNPTIFKLIIPRENGSRDS